MNSLKLFIREALILEDVTTQKKWQDAKKTLSSYERSAAGKVDSALAKLLESAWDWGSAALGFGKYGRSRGARGTPSTTRTTIRQRIRTAWSAGRGTPTQKWAIVGSSLAAVGLIGWGVLSWFNSSDTEPTEEEKLKAEEEIANFFDYVMQVLDQRSVDIAAAFRTDSLTTSGGVEKLDPGLLQMKQNSESNANRLVSFTGDDSKKYAGFYSEFPEFESVRSTIDAKISSDSSNDANRKAVLETYALRALIFSAATEISQAIIIDAHTLNEMFGEGNITIEKKIETESKTLVDSVNKKFKSDPEISTSVKTVEQMSV